MSDSHGMPSSMDLSAVNPEILETIFLRFPKEDLIKCRQVCHLWRNIINSRSFWIAKEDYEGETYLRDLVNTGKPLLGDVATLSIKKPFERELLVQENPDGKTEVTRHADPRWTFENAGNGWRYQSPPSFLGPPHFHPDFKPLFDGCHETSYSRCTKHFKISIAKLGLSPEIMDNYRPPIVFSEWVTNRSDCGCLYRSGIQLFGENGERIASEREDLTFDQWQYQRWVKAEVVMKSYPPGCREILVFSSGRDLQFWAGHYGPKMAGAQFMILMEETPLPTQPINREALEDDHM